MNTRIYEGYMMYRAAGSRQQATGRNMYCGVWKKKLWNTDCHCNTSNRLFIMCATSPVCNFFLFSTFHSILVLLLSSQPFISTFSIPFRLRGIACRTNYSPSHQKRHTHEPIQHTLCKLPIIISHSKLKLRISSFGAIANSEYNAKAHMKNAHKFILFFFFFWCFSCCRCYSVRNSFARFVSPVLLSVECRWNNKPCKTIMRKAVDKIEPSHVFMCTVPAIGCKWCIHNCVFAFSPFGFSWFRQGFWSFS